MSDSLRLILADDQPLFLEGLRGAIVNRHPGLSVVGTAANGREAVELVREHRPDLAVLDIRMPVMDGIACAAELKQIDPDIKIVLLTTFNESELLRRGLTAGINGYILKESPIDEIIDSIVAVARGNLYISADAASHVSSLVTGKEGAQERAGGDPEADQGESAELLRHLTVREREVLDLLLRGISNKQIADQVFLSEGTVRNYVHKIYQMLGVHTRAELFIWASENYRTGSES